MLEQRHERASDVAEEQRARRVEAHAVGRVGHADLEPHDPLTGEHLAGLLAHDGSPAECDDAIGVGNRGRDGLRLEATELLLAEGDEDVRDAHAGGCLDRVVGIEERDTQPLGHPATDTGLASAGRSHQNEDRSHQRTDRFSR